MPDQAQLTNNQELDTVGVATIYDLEDPLGSVRVTKQEYAILHNFVESNKDADLIEIATDEYVFTGAEWMRKVFSRDRQCD